jgi:hypothetical protein
MSIFVGKNTNKLRHVVDPTASPRVTPSNSPDSEPAATQQAIFLHSLMGILRARRQKSAICPKPRGNRSFVQIK